MSREMGADRARHLQALLRHLREKAKTCPEGQSREELLDDLAARCTGRTEAGKTLDSAKRLGLVELKPPRPGALTRGCRGRYVLTAAGEARLWGEVAAAADAVLRTTPEMPRGLVPAASQGRSS